MDWRIEYLFLRFDTYLVLGFGILCMISVAKWGIFRGKAGEIAELCYAVIWPLSFPLWSGFAYADGISIVISPFIALAFGVGFAIGVLRRSKTKPIRAIAGVWLVIALLSFLVPLLL